MGRAELEHELVELGADVDVDTLMARIRDYVHGRRPAPPDSVPATGEGPGGNRLDTDVDFDQVIVRALGLIAGDLRQVHLHATVMEGWLQEETAHNAQEGQRTHEQVERLSAQLDALDRRLAGLERQLAEGLDELRRSTQACESAPATRDVPRVRPAVGPRLLGTRLTRARREGR